MGSLLDELKRRRVFRAVFAWGIFSFAALQATEPLMHALGLPEWTLKAVVAALGLGFPITILLSWTFDLRSTGVERTAQAEPLPGAPSKARLALALVGLGVIVAAPGAAYLYFRSSSAADTAKASVGSPSIAVLAFADMSPGKDQEYLSDGIAEEILSSLSRVEGLRVAGRTSSFYFKGKGARLADIGRELNVGAVLEGGVRRDGDRIRVTATIVNVGDGFHAWSQSWDRNLKDILAVENEIAREVVEAMKVRLLAGRRSVVPDPAKTTAEAHLHVLKGRDAYRSGSVAGYGRATEEYERALKLDPNLAAAWAGLAQALDYDAEARPASKEEHLALKKRALDAADRAVAVGPEVAEAYQVRASMRSLHRHEWAEARADLEKAKSLGVEQERYLIVSARLLAFAGKIPEALATVERCVSLEPLSVGCNTLVGVYANALGQFAAARRAFEKVMEIVPDHAWASGYLAQTHVLDGRPQDALSEAARSRGHEGYRVTAVALAEHSLGRHVESRRALDDLIARFSHSWPFQIAEVCAWRGDANCAFQWLDRAIEREDTGVHLLTHSPFLASIRGDPRFAGLLRKMNLPLD